MKIILSVILFIYIILMAFVTIKSKEIKWYSKLINFVGILGLLIYIALIFYGTNLIALLIGGLASIVISSIINGYTLYGKLHIQHHIIRIILSVIFAILFYFV